MSEAYPAAITGTKRRIIARAVLDLIDPDMTYGTVTSSGADAYSKSEQIHNKTFDGMAKTASLELNRWVLDGTWDILPDNPSDAGGEYGFVGAALSGDDCMFDMAQYVQLNLSNLSILQAAAVYFSDVPEDGIAVDFVFSVLSGATTAYEQTVTSNTERAVYFDGFEAHDVTAIRVTVTRWSLPGRRMRVAEIVPGVYEVWDGDTIYAVDVLREFAPDNMTLPYSVANLTIYNKNKRFNPYAPNTILKSLEERQAIPISFGLELPDGSVEYLPAGTYYQKNGGWDTSAYGATFDFSLVCLIGLLSKRDYRPPEPLPVTVQGWIESILSHLGDKFTTRYQIDSGLADKALTASPELINAVNCGTLLRYIAMAIQAVCRTDIKTGNLLIEAMPDASSGIELTLDNMRTYPTIRPSDRIASIKFTLADNEEYVVAGDGSETDGDITYNIKNPFVTTQAAADQAAAYIMRYHAGNLYTLQGRGDLRSELTDIDTFATGFGGTHTARRYKQQIHYSRGVVARAPSYLVDDTEVTS